MEKIEIKKQTGTSWVDENGVMVELKRVTNLEKQREAHAVKIAAKAVVIEKNLKELKELMNNAFSAMQVELSKEAGTEVSIKGHTFYSFDGSLKIFREVSPEIEFDEGMMQAAYTIFQEYINTVLFAPEHAMVRELILSAFKTIRGKFDNRKITTLIQQKDNEAIKDNEQFQKAIQLVQSAKKIVSEKTYDRVFIKNNTGEYEQVNLNFSGI